MSKTILITGASSGIGKALALAYAKPNITLLITGRNETRLNETVDKCQIQGAHVTACIVDVTEKKAMHEWIIEQDKKQPIDLIIANAGCSSKQLETTLTEQDRIEQAMIDIHLHGTLNTLHPVLPRMLERRTGQIAIMSSMNAFFPLARSRIYGALKAGLYHYGLASRAHYRKHGIAVNVICPGWVNSALTALNDFPMPGKLTDKQAAEKIIQGLQKNKAVIAFPRLLRLTAVAYRLLPQCVRTRIASHC